MEVLIAILSSTLLTTIVQYIFRKIDTRKSSTDLTNEALKTLLYCKIKEKGESYLIKNSVTEEEYHDLKMLHDVYHKLGGNGFLDKIMKEIENLTFTV